MGGRGRGRGRKILTNGRSLQDKGSSGEEVVPARKRRGRPQKQRVAVAAADLAEAKNSVEGVLDGAAGYHHQQGEGGDDARLKENYPQDSNGNKRNRVPNEEMSSVDHHDLEENSSSARSSNDESLATRSSGGFRLNGSRRKSTPRRAAEAGI